MPNPGSVKSQSAGHSLSGALFFHLAAILTQPQQHRERKKHGHIEQDRLRWAAKYSCNLQYQQQSR
jgi:hypothetical protein